LDRSSGIADVAKGFKNARSGVTCGSIFPVGVLVDGSSHLFQCELAIDVMLEKGIASQEAQALRSTLARAISISCPLFRARSEVMTAMRKPF